jgi:hypothetical protein
MVCGLAHIPHTADEPWKTLLEKVTKGGGRLVVSLAADTWGGAEEKTGAEDTEAAAPPPPAEEPAEEHTEAPPLGLTLYRQPLGEDHAQYAERQATTEDGVLPEALIFRSSLYFGLNDPAWETVFSFETKPVVVRRTWGEGEIVMIADSYLFSNEALRSHRASDFLAWVVPPGGPVVFDEFHHGLSRQPGISALVRKYRLHGVVLSLVAVVALLIWKKAMVFAPRPADDAREREPDPGAETSGGWVTLMRRHIPPRNLPGVCLDAWQSSRAADRFSEEQVEQVRQMTRQENERQRPDPVAVYKSICDFLKQGKTL